MARAPLALSAAFLLAAAQITAQNPRLLRDINPGPASSNPKYFASFGTTTLFVANDSQAGYEPWRTDGSTANTRLILDTYPGPSSVVRPGAVVVDRYVYRGVGGPWVTDGTAAGTFLLRTLGSNSAAAPIGLGSSAVFVADDGSTGWELWRSDGTVSGTVVVADIAPGVASSSPNTMTRVGERLFFFTSMGTSEMWWTDGTAAGTARVPGFPIFPVQAVTMVAAGQRLFCMDWSQTPMLRIIDAAGVRPVVSVQWASRPVALGDDIMFVQDDAQAGREPWFSDGTAAGTRLIADIRPGSTGSNPQHFRSMGRRVLFLANDDGVSGFDLWISDGTTAGTQRLVDWPAGMLTSGIEVVCDDLALIPTRDANGQYELWVTDGTPAGTRRALVDVSFLHAHLGSIFVQRWTAALGREPYVFDPGALANEVGHGCGVGLRVPSLHSTRPRLGASVTLRGATAPTSGVGALALGRIADPPVRIGPTGGSCVAYVDLAGASIAYLFPTSSPTWSWTLPLPNVPVLQGVSFAAQAFYGPSANPAGFEVSNGVYLTLGH